MPPQLRAEPPSTSSPASGVGTAASGAPAGSRVTPPHPANTTRTRALHVRKLCTGKVSLVIVLVPRRECGTQANSIHAKYEKTTGGQNGAGLSVFVAAMLGHHGTSGPDQSSDVSGDEG